MSLYLLPAPPDDDDRGPRGGLTRPRAGECNQRGCEERAVARIERTQADLCVRHGSAFLASDLRRAIADTITAQIIFDFPEYAGDWGPA